MSENQPNHQSGPAVGAMLGKYRLEQELERRLPVLSFLAREQNTRQSYRIWTLALPALRAEDRIIYLGQFQQEASRLLSLQHPHLLPLSDYGIARDVPYLISPYFSARPFHQAQQTPQVLDLMQASRYLDQLANALEYAHQQGIWHLNLTTNCLLVKEDGNLVITELGITHILNAGASLLMKRPEVLHQEPFPVIRDVFGKPLYGLTDASAPAPEWLRGATIGTASDVYGLGAVLYRMLTGHRIFRGKTPEECVQQHLTLPVPTLSQWRPDSSADIEKVLATALARDPVKRFQRPGVFANAFHQAVAPLEKSRQPVTPPALPVIPSRESHLARQMPASRQTVPNQARNSSAYQASSPSKRVSRRRLVTLLATGTSVAAAVTMVTLFASHLSNGSPGSAISNSANSPGTNGSDNGSKTSGGGNGNGKEPPANVLARTSDIPVNSAKPFALNGSSNPGLLIHLANGTFVAFDSTCTHAGCGVAYNGKDKLLICPCHGASFDPARDAAVVQGPASTPLKAVPITIQADGSITKN